MRPVSSHALLEEKKKKPFLFLLKIALLSAQIPQT